MKTNVSIELSDGERNTLANVIDGKVTGRYATRKEVTALCLQHIGGLTNISASRETSTEQIKQVTGSDLYVIDPGDHQLMSMPNNPGYVRGWNTVKRGAA